MCGQEQHPPQFGTIYTSTRNQPLPCTTVDISTMVVHATMRWRMRDGHGRGRRRV